MSFWKKLKDKLSGAAHMFTKWFSVNVQPELLDFLDDNKALAMNIILDVARKYARDPGAFKKKKAAELIIAELKGQIPNLKSDSSWINLLIEVGVAALKSRGKL